MIDTSVAVDWCELMSSWDRQQEGYLPSREERFRVMFDAIEVLLGDEFLALDLACGPGSISQRLLARFPSARSVAVDLDPVLLSIGRQTLGTIDGRLRWVERHTNWHAGLSQRMFDVVLSTTALHWLTAPQLAGVYRQLATISARAGSCSTATTCPSTARSRRWRVSHVRSSSARRSARSSTRQPRTGNAGGRAWMRSRRSPTSSPNASGASTALSAMTALRCGGATAATRTARPQLRLRGAQRSRLCRGRLDLAGAR
jgi:SAM-dependent methyltransferase